MEWINYTKFDRWILTANKNQLIIYNAKTYEVQVNEKESNDIVSCDLAPNNKFIAYGMNNSEIKFHDFWNQKHMGSIKGKQLLTYFFKYLILVDINDIT